MSEINTTLAYESSAKGIVEAVCQSLFLFVCLSSECCFKVAAHTHTHTQTFADTHIRTIELYNF